MCFTVTLRVSNLWSSHYSEHQALLYKIIEQKQKSSNGYRKIARWLNENAYKNVHVPPAVGDEGQSLGTYMHADYVLNKNKYEYL